MALVNDVKKEIHAKIVYFGPAQGGKTTNLEFIYSKLKPEYRGKFKFMNTPSGRIVFFDFMRPELAGIKDHSIRFHIYTVPGDVDDVAIWKNVLKGADGVVFVADQEPSRLLQNRRSLESLKDILAGYGTTMGEIPCLFQCNKKDVADSSSMEQLKSLLDSADFRMVPASALSGEGVLPTLSEMVKMVLQKLRDLPIGSEDEEPVITAEPETAATEPHEETIAPPVETLAETISLAEGPEVQPVSMPDQPVETVALSMEPLEECALSEIPGEIPEALREEEITHDMIVDAPIGTVTEEPEVSETYGTIENIHTETVISEPAAVEPEIEVAGELEPLGGGRFRLPLVIRVGDREVKTALSLGISFEKSGM